MNSSKVPRRLESNPESLRETLQNDLLEQIKTQVKQAIARDRAVLVQGVFESLLVNLPRTKSGQRLWIPVRSLSGLRSLLGGKFSNLKRRWLAAGFPLRESRGDRSGISEVNESGWNDLKQWILEQGYEARLLLGDDVGIFEVRAISNMPTGESLEQS